MRKGCKVCFELAFRAEGARCDKCASRPCLGLGLGLPHQWRQRGHEFAMLRQLKPAYTLCGFFFIWGFIMADYLARIVGLFTKRYKDMGDGSHAEQVAVTALPDEPLPVYLPEVLITGGGIGGNSPRLRVDTGQTGFFARRMWELTYEFASANPIAATPLVFRLIIPVNFIIHAHALSIDQGGLTLRTYAAAQGTAGGTFDTPFDPVSANSMTENAPYAFQSQIASGGTFTPNVGQRPLTPIRLRTAGATAQQSSVGGAVISEKARAAGTYYAVLARMTGVSGDCTGTYTLVIEERP